MEGYTSYQHLQLGWTDILPSHWGVKRLKRVLSERKENNNPVKTNEILSLTNTRGVILYSEKGNIGNKSKENIEGYHLTYPNDLVVNSMNVVIGSVGVSDYFGAISPVYYALMSRGEANIKYYEYIFRLPSFEETLKGLGNGILEIRMRIPMSKLNNVLLPLPPRIEQDQIVRFLDWKVSDINKLIGIRWKEIQELEELRENTILHATTSGLDTSVPMKRTDNFWIGTIPEHWNVVQVRRVYSVILGKMLATKPAYSSDTYEEYVCAKDVHFDGVDLSDLKQMWFSTSEKQQYKIEANDLLIVEGGAGAGNAALVEEPLDRDIYVQNSIHIVRPKSNRATTKFLAYWMRSMVKRNYMTFVCSVATIPHYTKDKVMSTVMPLPPENEQKEIVRYLDNECEKINNLITKKHSQIETLQELKNSLISDIVTGKIDVRNITVPEYEHVDDIVDDDSENNEETETDGEEA